MPKHLQPDGAYPITHDNLISRIITPIALFKATQYYKSEMFLNDV